MSRPGETHPVNERDTNMINRKQMSVPRFFHRRSKKVGLAPGTLEYIGGEQLPPVKVKVMDYGPTHLDEKTIAAIEEWAKYRGGASVSWINIDGVHDVELLRKLGASLDLHPLVLEDIVNTHQRPKFEDYENYIFIVLRMLRHDESRDEVMSEQISVILGDHYVISVQETEGDVFDPVRKRIRDGKGRIRKMGPDYLAYALLDAVIDHYFVILENYGDKIETLEEALVGDPTPELLRKIHHFKREMILLRKSVWPLREVVGGLERSESPLIKKSVVIFLRDVYDHTIQVIDAVESFRDMISGMQDLYLSSISNRMNEVMKVLTIIATIFVPLTFVAGIYGMNFEFMPELKWKWSYAFFWGVIMGMGGLMLRFFHKKRWI